MVYGRLMVVGSPKWTSLSMLREEGSNLSNKWMCGLCMSPQKNKAIFSSIVKLTAINVWQHNCLVIGWPMAFKKYGRKICCNYFSVDFEHSSKFYLAAYHSSEIRGLCWMKLSSEMLQNVQYFWNTVNFEAFRYTIS